MNISQISAFLGLRIKRNVSPRLTPITINPINLKLCESPKNITLEKFSKFEALDWNVKISPIYVRIHCFQFELSVYCEKSRLLLYNILIPSNIRGFTKMCNSKICECTASLRFGEASLIYNRYRYFQRRNFKKPLAVNFAF